MEFKLNFDINEKIYLRNPESSEIGKLMIKKAIDLICELGFEQFTFKKLALEINSTEATIYRYFENKHRILLYILNWYWCFMDFLFTVKLENISDNREKLKLIIKLLSNEFLDNLYHNEYNKIYLNKIVIAESSKAYLVKDIIEINKNEVFKPYKDLSGKIADVISLYNPNYKFPRSLSTTLIETSHNQQFFSMYLPKLTDDIHHNGSEFTRSFLEDFVFKILD